MRIEFRAAALAAAAGLLWATGAISTPTYASESEAAPAPVEELWALPLSEETLGLNELTDAPAADQPVPALPGDEVIVPGHDDAPVLLPSLEDPSAESQRGRPLADLVADFSADQASDGETDCLARAVYFESNGEPYIGRLAVAEVIINRARSGRFASTICGVVRQRGQFSFVRRGYIPRPPAGRGWRQSVAIAEIATRDLADSAASRALFFHARYVRPGWRLTRVATVGNHIFYR